MHLFLQIVSKVIYVTHSLYSVLWCLCVHRTDVKTDMTPEERDARTVFCMQLSARIRARDLEEFFSSVGKVKTLLPYGTNVMKNSYDIFLRFEKVFKNKVPTNLEEF